MKQPFIFDLLLVIGKLGFSARVFSFDPSVRARVIFGIVFHWMSKNPSLFGKRWGFKVLQYCHGENQWSKPVLGIYWGTRFWIFPRPANQ